MKLSIETNSKAATRQYAEGYGKDFARALEELMRDIREKKIVVGDYFTPFWVFRVDNAGACQEDRCAFLYGPGGLIG